MHTSVSATASRIHYERNRLYPNLEATIEILSSFVRLLYNWYPWPPVYITYIVCILLLASSSYAYSSGVVVQK